MACQRICDSLTWHVFSTPPTKVYEVLIYSITALQSNLYHFFKQLRYWLRFVLQFDRAMVVWLINYISRNWNMDTELWDGMEGTSARIQSISGNSTKPA
jgi:hypothetical protein